MHPGAALRVAVPFRRLKLLWQRNILRFFVRPASVLLFCAPVVVLATLERHMLTYIARASRS
jgi:hypothetical protein